MTIAKEFSTKKGYKKMIIARVFNEKNTKK
jgi:hypothetical protein